MVKSSTESNFFAAEFTHNGDWLFAFIIASCGLKLEDLQLLRVHVLELDPVCFTYIFAESLCI